jgi:hypothetical protein
MKIDLSPAVEALRNQLHEQEAEANETRKMINSLLRRMGEDLEFPEAESGQMQMRMNGAVRPDQYYGKAFATAAQEYLERRKQACSAEEIMTALEQGGFDFKKLGWKERKDWPRLTAISLAKNNQKFHKLPNGTFGLLSWYPDIAKRNENGSPPVKKKRGRRRKTSKAKGPKLLPESTGLDESGIQPAKKRGRPPKIGQAADQVSRVETA